MIDVRIEDRTILKEREITGNSLDLMTEVVTFAAYVLDFVAKDEVSYTILRNALAEGIKKLEVREHSRGKARADLSKA